MGEKPSSQSIVYSERERELAERSQKFYSDGELDKALTDLKELIKLRPYDTRILQNLSLCEYALSGQTKTSQFGNRLNEIEKLCRKEIGDDEKTLLKRFPTFLYNKAVTAFHQRRFEKSLEILEQLQNLFEGDEGSHFSGMYRLKVLYLSADCHLSMKEPNIAIKVLEKMNKYINEADDCPAVSLKHWKNRLNACYCKAYLQSCSVGFDRPKQPSAKDSKVLTKSSSHLSVFAKAAFELKRGNEIKAMKILNSEVVEETPADVVKQGESCQSMYYNNLGIILHRMNKYSLASGCFQKAAFTNDDAVSQLPRCDVNLNGRPLVTFSLSKKNELLKNLGITKLFYGLNQDAFKLLLKSSETDYDCPRIWLRVAECCIAHNCSNNESEEQVIQEFGEGCARLVIANSPVKKIEPETTLEPSLTLSYAYKCLQNALELTPTLDSSHSEYLNVSRLRSGTLASIAFVCVRLGKFSEAVDFSSTCINSYPETGYSYLAALYKAEALLELDAVTESISTLKHAVQLSSDALKWINTDSHSRSSSNISCPKSYQQAKVLACSNLAAAYCVSGEYEKAAAQITIVRESIPPELISIKTVLLAVYLLLKRGQRQMALNILRTGNISLFN